MSNNEYQHEMVVPEDVVSETKISIEWRIGLVVAIVLLSIFYAFGSLSLLDLKCGLMLALFLSLLIYFLLGFGVYKGIQYIVGDIKYTQAGMIIFGICAYFISVSIYCVFIHEWPVQQKSTNVSVISSPRPEKKSEIVLTKGMVLEYTLEPNETTPWHHAPTGVNYNVFFTEKNSPHRIYYWNGTIVDVPANKGVSYPDIAPATFQIANKANGRRTVKISGI